MHENDMEMAALASYAMATRFELLLWGSSEARLRSIGEEALEEIALLEAQMSFYRPTSEISWINARAAYEAVPVGPRLFGLLMRAWTLYEETQGAFDITVAPLIRCWGFTEGTGQMPSAQAVEDARSLVGMEHVILDPERETVHFDRPGVMLDLGAIGKGYAVDCAVEVLQSYGITSALLHGGSSSIYALGAPPGETGWRVAIQKPFDPEPEHYLTRLALQDTSLSVSAPHGKWFASEGRRYGHVIDPRTGYPAGSALLAALVTASATESDALSTALLTLGPEWLPALVSLYPDVRALVAVENEAGETVVTSHGILSTSE